MCTLSFVPKRDGYLIAMNRDELLTRGVAQCPVIHKLAGTNSVYPADVEGGTWIAANDRGETWALLNRNGGQRSSRKLSRGQLVLGALATRDFDQLSNLLSEVGLFNFLPFRLIGVSLSSQRVREWVWDGTDLTTLDHPWHPTHWFSSGISDATATEQRGKVFEAAARRADAGSLPWLRRIHASHGAAPGAFSVCVHRDDAATVSYTEIEAGSGRVEMRYHAGSPCIDLSLQAVAIPFDMPELSTHSV